jgi:hypothetical protein
LCVDRFKAEQLDWLKIPLSPTARLANACSDEAAAGV